MRYWCGAKCAYALCSGVQNETVVCGSSVCDYLAHLLLSTHSSARLLTPAGKPRRPFQNRPMIGVERYPAGTTFVTHDRGRTLFVAKDTLYLLQLWQADARCRQMFKRRRARRFLPDGSKVLLHYFTDTKAFRISDLHPLDDAGHSFMWWEGERLGYFDHDQELYVGGRRHPLSIGRNDLVAAEDHGNYFLSLREIKPPTNANYGVPTHRMLLWRRGAHGKLRLSSDLGTDEFDRFQGDPCHLVTLPGRIVLRGMPAGGGVGLDRIGVWRRGQGATSLKNSLGEIVEFGNPGPVVTGDSIVGIGKTFSSDGAQYLYRITMEKITVTPAPKNLVFVTIRSQARGGNGAFGSGGRDRQIRRVISQRRSGLKKSYILLTPACSVYPSKVAG